MKERTGATRFGASVPHPALRDYSFGGRCPPYGLIAVVQLNVMPGKSLPHPALRDGMGHPATRYWSVRTD